MEQMTLAEPLVKPALNNENWFADVLKASNNLKEEVVIRNVLKPELVEKLHRLQEFSLSELCRLQALEYGFRVWRNDEQRNIHYLRKHVFANAPEKYESIGSWMERIFPEEETCIIMNNIERFSDDIGQLMSVLFKPVIDHVGIPLNGLHSTSIFGDYTYTPLGIHHDSKGSFVMSLHLGPGTKEMYTWEWDHYLSIGGKDNEKNIEKFLPEAKKYTIYPGDVYFMPWDKFHVGRNQGFSITLTNWFDFHSANRLMYDVINFMGDTFMKLQEDFLSEPVTEHNFKDKFGDILNSFNFEGGRDQKSLRQNLLDAQEFKMLRTFSNCGWKSVPFTRKEIEGYDKMNYEDLRFATVRSLNPFKIYSKVIDSNIYLFVRGHVFKYDYQPEIDRIVEQLNTFQELSVSELLENHRPDSWSEDTFLYFLSSLYNLKGIEIL